MDEMCIRDSLDPDGEQYEIQYDNQVQKAIEVLSEKTQND